MPPTAVGGCFQIFSTRHPQPELLNPTNGSWWNVQVLSTKLSTNQSGARANDLEWDFELPCARAKYFKVS